MKILLNSSGLTQENQEPLAACLNTTSIKEQTNLLRELSTASKCFTINDIKKRPESRLLDIQGERDSKTTNEIIP